MDLALNNQQRLICHKTQTTIYGISVSLGYLNERDQTKLEYS